MRFEYKIVPAPTKSLKNKGLKSSEDRFAYTLEELLNGMAAEGWEYQRAETLPSLERAGLTSTTTEWRNVLVFRKMVAESAATPSDRQLTATAQTTPELPAGAAAVTEPALRADAPASIVPDDEETEDHGKPPAFLGTSAADEANERSATDADENTDKPKT